VKSPDVKLRLAASQGPPHGKSLRLGPVNFNTVAGLLAGALLPLAGGLLVTAVMAWVRGTVADTYPLLYAALVTLALAGFGYYLGRQRGSTIFTADALVTVAATWILFGFLGALPFVFAGVADFTDAWFESISGFSTTGASIFPAPSQLSQGLLFWRALTHWFGGLGIILLYLALFPQIGAGAKHLFSHEATGPITDTLKPRLKQTARTLWRVYLTLTVANIVLLMICGMGWFDAVCHAFATLATGGFSTQDASIGQYHSLPIELVTVTFMILAGINFSLYARALRGRSLGVFWRDTEFRAYLVFLALAVLIVADSLVDTVYPGLWQALRSALFQTVSYHTCTGFATDDANRYPALAQILLVMVMFLGGSAGSTAGGLKIARIVLLAKVVFREVYCTFRPNAVLAIKMSGSPVDNDTIRTIGSFLALAVASYAIGALAMAALGLDAGTALSAPAACLWGVGPGMSVVGSMGNYSTVPTAGKWLLSALMLLGRLEFFTFLVVFSPRFWKR
jgi:trk system potassium uptake protein TrkH